MSTMQLHNFSCIILTTSFSLPDYIPNQFVQNNYQNKHKNHSAYIGHCPSYSE